MAWLASNRHNFRLITFFLNGRLEFVCFPWSPEESPW